MNSLEPIIQTKLYGLDKYLHELIKLYKNNNYPNKILLSGQKGIGKATMAFHFINYVLTLNEDHKYDLQKFTIIAESSQFKTILNKSNTNFISINVSTDKKTIDINQIRQLIIQLNKSSFNTKPRFVLIDNIRTIKCKLINDLLKVLEEPNENIYFILIHNNKKILSTLLSRCINFKMNLTHKDCIEISNILLNDNLENLVSNNLINYYSTPGEIYNLVQFSLQNKYNISKIDLKSFLQLLIKDVHYKKNDFIYNLIYNIEFYLEIQNFSDLVYKKYSYFIKKISANIILISLY